MSTHYLRFDQRASTVVEAYARACDYSRLSVFPGRP
jgi:hypothetical protein